MSVLTEQQARALELTEQGLVQTKVAEEMGITQRRVSQLLAKARKKLAAAQEYQDSPGVLSGLAEAGVDPSLVKHGWQKTETGSYFFKAGEGEDRDAFAEAIRSAVEGFVPVPLHRDEAVAEAALATLYGLWDVHLGMRSWARETGENYDVDEARRVAEAGIADLISRSPDAMTGLLLIGGDFTHADDETAQTPASKHQLDVDGRFYRTAEAALRLLIALTDMLRQKHLRVIVRVLPGNHDPHSAKWLTVALAHMYRSDDAVEVVEDPHEFFFFRHGKCLIASHHGHRRKMQDVAAAIPALRPRCWGETRFRYYFQGHVHHERMGIEANGVLCRAMGPVTAKDSYAAQMAFSSGRSMSALTFHESLGLYSEARHPILPPQVDA